MTTPVTFAEAREALNWPNYAAIGVPPATILRAFIDQCEAREKRQRVALGNIQRQLDMTSAMLRESTASDTAAEARVKALEAVLVDFVKSTESDESNLCDGKQCDARTGCLAARARKLLEGPK